MPINKETLKDDELEKISGGRLRDDWKDQLGHFAKVVCEKGMSFSNFEIEVLRGDYDRYISVVNNNKGVSSGEKDMIRKYLKTIKW